MLVGAYTECKVSAETHPCDCDAARAVWEGGEEVDGECCIFIVGCYLLLDLWALVIRRCWGGVEIRKCTFRSLPRSVPVVLGLVLSLML